MEWKIEDELLVKEYEFADFTEAVGFVNKILVLAEKAGHHPDVLVHSYNKVKVMLFTHDKGQITDKDHALAQEIDSITA